MASNKIEIRPTKTEPVPEETYPDLLPYEMERVEAVMGHMAKSGKVISDSEKEALTSINSSLTSAKMKKENSWGHQWRPTPDMSEDVKAIADMKDLGSARTAISASYWDEVFKKRDPILESALKDKEAILCDTGDTIRPNDIYPPTDEERAQYHRLLKERFHGEDD